MQESEWSKSIPFKEQKNIIKRMFLFAKPFRKTFYATIFFAFVLSIINILLPLIIQTFMDNYLTNQTATQQVIYFFLCVVFLWGVGKSRDLVFPMVPLFNGFFKNLSIYSSKII